jgi:hypothetical protein
VEISQARDIVDLLREAAVPSEWSQDRLKLAWAHVRALPYDWTLRNARRWVANPNIDAKGNLKPKFLNTVDEVLEACGVHSKARDAVSQAAYTAGAQVMVDYRNEFELTYVGPNDPLPQGVYEHLVNNRLPVPNREVKQVDYAALRAGSVQQALPAPDGGAPMSPEEAKSFIQELVKRPTAPKEQRLVSLEGDDVLRSLAFQQLPTLTQDAVKRLVWKVEALQTHYIEMTEALEERWRELESALSGAGKPLGKLEAVKRLSRSLAEEQPGLLQNLLEAVVGAYHPPLREVKIRIQRVDDFEDDSPVVRMRVDFTVPSAPPRQPPMEQGEKRPPSRNPQRLGSMLAKTPRRNP